MTYDASSRSTEQLLADWAAVMRELRSREVIRTNNNPVGDIAEALVHQHFGGERGGSSQKGWDVLAPGGERIQVKAVRHGPGSRRTALSPIRDDSYDSVVVVVFDEAFQVEDVMKLDRSLAEEIGGWSAHVNGRILRLPKLKADDRVEHLDPSQFTA